MRKSCLRNIEKPTLAIAELKRIRWTGADGGRVVKGQGTRGAGVRLTGGPMWSYLQTVTYRSLGTEFEFYSKGHRSPPDDFKPEKEKIYV